MHEDACEQDCSGASFGGEVQPHWLSMAGTIDVYVRTVSLCNKLPMRQKTTSRSHKVVIALPTWLMNMHEASISNRRLDWFVDNVGGPSVDQGDLLKVIDVKYVDIKNLKKR